MPEQVSPDADAIDLHQLLAVLGKWRWIIALVTVLATATSGILSFFVLRPVYQSEATLMVINAAPSQPQQATQSPQGLQGLVQSISSIPVVSIGTYVGELTDPAFLAEVAKQLPPQPDGKPYTYSVLSKIVQASAVTDTNLIRIDASSTDPRTAAQIANTMASAFLNRLSQRNSAQMASAVQFLQSQADNVKGELAAAQGDLVKLESQARPAALVQSQLTARTADLNRTTTDLTQAQVQVASLTAAQDLLQQRLAATPTTVAETTTDPVTHKATISQVVNPVYIALQEQLNTNEQQLAQAQAQVSGLQGNLKQLEDTVGTVQADLTGKQAAENQVNDPIQRLAKAYDTISQQITQTQVAEGVKIGETNVTQASQAEVPVVPVKPNKRLNVALGFVLGAMVGVFLAFLLEFLDNTIKGPEDVEAHLGLASLGMVPHFRT